MLMVYVVSCVCELSDRFDRAKGAERVQRGCPAKRLRSTHEAELPQVPLSPSPHLARALLPPVGRVKPVCGHTNTTSAALKCDLATTRVVWGRECIGNGAVVSRYVHPLSRIGTSAPPPSWPRSVSHKKAEPQLLHKTKVATGGRGNLIGKALLVGGEGVGARALSVIVLFQAFERRLMQFVARVPIYPRSLLMLLVLLRPSPARCLSGRYGFALLFHLLLPAQELFFLFLFFRQLTRSCQGR